ncbi:hypothetical protein RvY_01390 [Ramazzottius varieornatus]|uniref:Uncharacterized protein n=1 Tax=Ramazzottius varieornatus TaxID=947166 RepID=A0A1D1UM83_RAMVA|nr:hypothetical protein RvY_01390 [Ramazzottius varieornatus]
MASSSSAKRSRLGTSSSATLQSQESRQEQENNHGLPQFEQDIQLVRTCTQTLDELDQLQTVMDVAGNQSMPTMTHWLNEKLMRLTE